MPRRATLFSSFAGNYAFASPVTCISPHEIRVHRSRFFQLSSTKFSITSEKQTSSETLIELLDPYEILRDLQKSKEPEEPIQIPYPTHLSPTSLECFQKCPQAFFFQYILKLKPDPPTTPELARGIICHKALEDVFDLKPEDRSLVNLENLFRKEWKEKRGDREGYNNGDGTALEGDEEDKNNMNGETYDSLFRVADASADYDTSGASFSYDIEEEIKWGKYSLQLLQNYYELEDPRKVHPPNPLVREMWVSTRFNLNNDDNLANGSEKDQLGRNSIVVRGKIDRIDMHHHPTLENKIYLRIIDYKTGKKPNFKYSPAVNERIANEQFWKMKVYALILWKMIIQSQKNAMMKRNGKSGTTPDDLADGDSNSKHSMSWVIQQKLLQAMDQIDSNQNWSEILELHSLRLMYLTSHLDDTSAGINNNDNSSSIGKARYLDFQLGNNPMEFQSILDQTQQEIQSIGNEIVRLVDLQDPRAFTHCDWKYCNCHEFRRKFRGGTVWSRERGDAE